MTTNRYSTTGLALACLALTLAPAGLRAEPALVSPPDAVLNPTMMVAPPPDEETWNAIQAINQGLSAQQFITTNDAATVHEDEFSDGSKTAALRKANAETFRAAQALFDGKSDFTVTLDINLRRYNTENQMYLTTATANRIKFSIWGAPPSYGRDPYLHYMLLERVNQFSGLRIDPVHAKQLATITRNLAFTINCRFIPNSLQRQDNGCGEVGAVMACYKISTDLPQEIRDAMHVEPYQHTASDEAFLKAFAGHVLTAPGVGIEFLNGWKYALFKGTGTLWANIRARNPAYTGAWYVMGNKLIMTEPGYALDTIAGIEGRDGVRAYEIKTDGSLVLDETDTFRPDPTWRFKVEGGSPFFFPVGDSPEKNDGGAAAAAITGVPGEIPAPPSAATPAPGAWDAKAPAVFANGAVKPAFWTTQYKMEQGFQDLVKGSATMVLKQTSGIPTIPRGASLMIPNPTGKLGTPDAPVALARWVNNRIPFVKLAAGYAWPSQELQLPLTLTAVPNGLQAAPGQLAPGDYALLVDDKVIAFHVD